MSGPTPMTLGPFAFQALGFSLKDLKRHLETPWSALEVCGRMEALHWTGPKSEAVTIAGVLFPEEWGGLGSLAGVRSAAKSGALLPLIAGSGEVFGLFSIQGVEEDRGHMDAGGNPRKDAYSIKLKLHGDQAGGAIGSLLSLF